MELGLTLGGKSSKKFHRVTGKAPAEFTKTADAAQTFPSAAGGCSLSCCMAVTINSLNQTNQKLADDAFINEDDQNISDDQETLRENRRIEAITDGRQSVSKLNTHLHLDLQDPLPWFSDKGSSDDNGMLYRKKLRLTKQQSAYLENSFKYHSILNPKQKHELAKQLNLSPRQVEVWFQNRRARTKLKQTEMDYEYLKKCCEALTEENRRLCKEVQELRALKASRSNSFPTTLIMCPSCDERVAQSTITTTSVPPHRRSMSTTPSTPFLQAAQSGLAWTGCEFAS